jgi:hypothetical protein
MGKEHDAWMGEADKFWKKSFPDVQRTAPSVFVRLAFPINDKAVIKSLENILKNSPGSPFTGIKEAGQREFFDLDFEVLDEKVVVKFIKCAMEDYNGPFIENIKQMQTSAPPELLEALK